MQVGINVCPNSLLEQVLLLSDRLSLGPDALQEVLLRVLRLPTKSPDELTASTSIRAPKAAKELEESAIRNSVPLIKAEVGRTTEPKYLTYSSSVS